MVSCRPAFLFFCFLLLLASSSCFLLLLASSCFFVLLPLLYLPDCARCIVSTLDEYPNTGDESNQQRFGFTRGLTIL